MFVPSNDLNAVSTANHTAGQMTWSSGGAFFTMAEAALPKTKQNKTCLLLITHYNSPFLTLLVHIP